MKTIFIKDLKMAKYALKINVIIQNNSLQENSFLEMTWE